MRHALVIGAVAWPLVLGAALWHRTTGATGTLWPAVVYAAAGQVCHQQPERSFETAGASWPVCARCAGLYLAAPLGAFWAAARRRSLTGLRTLLVLAAVPTALTLAWEWAGFGTPVNLVRFLSAWPLGAMVAAAVVGVTHRID